LQNVTLSYPSITVQQFQKNLASTVMDDLLEVGLDRCRQPEGRHVSLS
jgi:hypothetical protein